MNADDETAENRLNAVSDTLTECLRQGRGAVITNPGTFYLQITSRGDSVFRFLPSQKLRSLFGWFPTYKGN